MFSEYKQYVELSTPGRFEGEGPMTAYVWDLFMNGDNGDDEVYFGDSDGAIRFGRRVMASDSNGFVSLRKYATVSDAKHVMDALHEQFDATEEDELPEIDFAEIEAARVREESEALA